MIDLRFDNPVHANGGLIFVAQDELCCATKQPAVEPGGGYAGHVDKQKREEEEAVILAGVALILYRMLL